MTGDEPPDDSAVVAQAGPWTVRSCVTASCTRCGAAPLDEDTRLTPHFASIDQAREELPRDWGWTCGTRSSWPQDDQLLCPACAKAGNAPGEPAFTADGSRPTDAAPRRADAPVPDPGLPDNTRIPPPGTRGKKTDQGGDADV